MRARGLAERLLEADPELAAAEHGPLQAAMREAFGAELGWLLKA